MTTSADRSSILADVSRAGSIIPPTWPLTSFVAVNPLGGFQHLPFDDATASARAWFGARTHLDLGDYRAEHAKGTVTDADLDAAVVRRRPDLAGSSVRLGEVDVPAVAVVRWDLLHGPTHVGHRSRDAGALVGALDELAMVWCAAYVDESHVPWAMPERDEGFYAAWRAGAVADRRLRRLLGRGVRRRIAALPDDPVELLDLVFTARRLGEEDRVAALRGLLLRTPGWASFARWCDDWAPADRSGPKLRMTDLAAVRAALDHIAGGHLDLLDPWAADGSGDEVVAARTDAAVAALGVGTVSDAERSEVGRLLGGFDEHDRVALALSAHEWNFRDRLLTRLAPAASASDRARPDAQLVFCIDVRSEGYRRHLESLGAYETFGFAGFFGVPVRWRPIGSDLAQARCPVLVSPRHEVSEVAVTDPDAYLAACSAEAGLHDAFHAAKGGIGSPFALAESAGWFAGPLAAIRTLVPARRDRSPVDGDRARWWRRRADPPTTAPVVAEGDERAPRSGLSLEERTLFAEAIVTTIGMAEFAPLVVLTGHGSHTVNNPHASSLDCGACGGAPGGASARIAAAILNDGEVRTGLAERGIELPDDTWFLAAEHDTTADTVTLLDRHLVPAHLHEAVVVLERDLAIAGDRNAQDRSQRLPGDPARVRDRGHDWAQVRPEWGLAGNGAFVIGPRSITASHDLRGRAFLHSYDAERDPDGVALETIMTAPLVVAQWISAQYYFSTVDPERFGAGDKMLHNPVGGIGVVLGDTGDLAVGLPLQSVMLGDQRAHDPLRLLAVVQAPLDRIERIITHNTGLRELVEGEWIHVVGRSAADQPWSVRVPSGGWAPWEASSGAGSADTSTDVGTADLSTDVGTADLLSPLEIS